MAAKCEICGKGPVVGNNVSHANNKTKRLFKPNLQRTKILINGQMKSVRICTRCLRTRGKKAA